MSTQYFDGVIVGGGLVGAAMALALAEQGKNIALLELNPPSLNLQDADPHWDARIYAISPSNEAFLRSLNAWPAAKRIQSVLKMDVQGDAGGRIEFDAKAIGAPHLTSIVENRWLLQALWQRIQTFSNITVLTQKAQVLQHDAKHVRLQLADGSDIAAALLMAADGANSWVRSQTMMAVHEKPYHHHGIVANYQTEQAHDAVARQWFKDGDVLAYLPLPNQQISIVWSSHKADELMALSDEDFAHQVALQGEHSLGKLTPMGRRFAFELILRRPANMYATRIALLGDAAHTIHPLAGQGVNLGFGDVQVLAKLLANSHDWGSLKVLRQYESQRLHAVRSMQMGCDGLFHLFKTQASPVSWLRNNGLNLINQVTGVKSHLIRQAMGL